MTVVDSQAQAKTPDAPIARAGARLQALDIDKSLNGAAILSNVTFDAKPGRITGIIGPNGAGKTTLLNVVAGILRPDTGTILLRGKDISRVPLYRRAALGLTRTFQLSRELGALSVLENLMVARRSQTGEAIANVFLRRGKSRREEQLAARKSRQLLERVGLWDLADAPARTLSGGQKKLLELARALMLDPAVILLDEPAAGVSPPLRIEISNLIRELREEGRTLVIVEHDMDVVARLCDHVYVLAQGQNLTEGTFKQVSADERVISAYLGGVA